ncbi:hypothetical protein HYX58_03300 [Candidatus Dependentiae bacterium]|nr:hypothetical protein [Candidatus Dependentiae bacterium]
MKAQKLETEPECVSCYENTDEPLMSLDCDPRHRFHVSCISTWFGKNKTCPTCRQPAVSLDETKIFFWEKIKSGRIKPAEIFNEVESMSVLARLKRFELKDQNEMLIKEKDNYKQLYESEKKSYKNLDRKYYEEQAEWSQKNALLKIQRNAILITCGIGICFLGYKRIFSK